MWCFGVQLRLLEEDLARHGEVVGGVYGSKSKKKVRGWVWDAEVTDASRKLDILISLIQSAWTLLWAGLTVFRLHTKQVR